MNLHKIVIIYDMGQSSGFGNLYVKLTN